MQTQQRRQKTVATMFRDRTLKRRRRLMTLLSTSSLASISTSMSLVSPAAHSATASARWQQRLKVFTAQRCGARCTTAEATVSVACRCACRQDRPLEDLARRQRQHQLLAVHRHSALQPRQQVWVQLQRHTIMMSGNWAERRCQHGFQAGHLCAPRNFFITPSMQQI